MPKAWKIELCEREVVIGRPVDKLVLGRPLSHPFLVLLNECGDVQSELHGTPYDKSAKAKTGSGRPGYLSRAFEYSAAVTTPLGLDRAIYTIVSQTPWKDSYPVLRARVCNRAHNYGQSRANQTIETGKPSDMAKLWYRLCHLGTKIDDMDLSYNRYGIGENRYNCQSMIATTLHHAGISARPSGIMASPGWKLAA